MICIAIFQPDGTGGYSSEPWGAWTSSDVDVVQSSITFKANTLTSVDRIGNTFDASRAQGGVPSPITGSFSVADMLAIGRISSELFSGAAPFMGWRVRIWLGRRRDGSDLSEPWNQGEFACSGADHDSDTITIQVIQTYALNARAIGTGVAGQVVGLVVGQHEVVVPTPELPEPVAIERTGVHRPNDWYSGTPSVPFGVYVPQTRATGKDNPYPDYYYITFMVTDPTEQSRMISLINSRGPEIVASGKKFSSLLTQDSGGGYALPRVIPPSFYPGFAVRVQRDFYESEEPENIALYFRNTKMPIVAGAQEITGWIDGSRIVTPLADVSVDTTNFVLSAQPRIITADGFASLTRIGCEVAWQAPATPAYSEIGYYGGVDDIATNESDPIPAWSSYAASDLKPDSGSSSFTFWGALNYTNRPTASIPLRLYAKAEDSEGYDGFLVDFQSRVTWKNAITVDGFCKYSFPLTTIPDATEFASVGETLSREYPLKGVQAYSGFQRRDTIDAINLLPALTINYPSSYSGYFYINYQIAAVHLYGVSYLSPGSTEAIVKPGPSIYPDSSVSTITAAQYILQEAGGNVYNVNDPFGNFGPVNQAWIGAYIEPDKTLAEAAHDLANDLWYVLPPASNRTQLAAMPEVFEAPEVPLGRLEDVVTEPVIEYGNGLRAYIQNIDQEFDPARPNDFYGGWGFLRDDLTGTPLINYGFSAWSTCRDAYLRHGIKASETFKAPSIQEADALGYIWTQTNRNGVSRLEWLSNPPRFATFKVATDSPGSGFAWAGTRVTIPQKMASYAGYDWSAWGVATEGATITEASIDPISLEITYTVILPPTLEIPGASPWINDSETGDFINDAETGDFINDATR